MRTEIENTMRSEVLCIGFLTILDPNGNPIGERSRLRLRVQTSRVSGGKRDIRSGFNLPERLADGNYSARIEVVSPDERRVFTEATNISLFTIGDSVVIERPREPALTMGSVTLDPDKALFFPGDELSVILGVKNVGADVKSAKASLVITDSKGRKVFGSDESLTSPVENIPFASGVSFHFAHTIPPSAPAGAYIGRLVVTGAGQENTLLDKQFPVFSVADVDAGAATIDVSPAAIEISTANRLAASGDARLSVRSSLIQVGAKITLRFADDAEFVVGADGHFAGKAALRVAPIILDISGEYTMTSPGHATLAISKYSVEYLDVVYAGWIELPCEVKISSGDQSVTGAFKWIVSPGDGLE